MLDSLLVVAKQVAILFALMGVGAVCNRLKLLNDKSIKGINELLALIVAPCVIVHAFQRPFEPHLLKGLGWAVAFAALSHALGVICAYIFYRGKDERRRCVYRFAITFSNGGFMGIPLEYAVLGTDGVFFGAVYVAMFNVMCWSWGLVEMCGRNANVKLSTMFINPGTMGILCGLPFFFFSWQLPSFVGEPVRMLADLNTPLAMLMIGYFLAEASFSSVLRCTKAYLAFFLRLVVIPCLLLALILACHPENATMVVAIVIAGSAPVAAYTTVFSVKFDRDVPLSVGLVAASTLLSILTMPPIVALAMWLTGK